MAICVEFVNGSLVQSTDAVGQCTAYVLQTASDYATTNPSITIDDVNILAWSVIGVWALAWSIKILRRGL